MERLYPIFYRFSAFELGLCVKLNHICRFHWLVQFFRLISWLGNGKFWYVLIILIPLIWGQSYIIASVHMALTGAIALLIYKLIKSSTTRVRPYAQASAIHLGTPPLDQYSFPSGHTLHAVNFTIVACYYCPELLPLLGIFTLLTAISRVVLGLHYPTDVLIGALIGAIVSITSIQIII